MSRKISKKYFNFKLIVFMILIFTNFIGLVLFSKANIAAKLNANQQEAANQNANQQEAANQNANQQEAANQNANQQEAANQNADQQEAANQNANQQEAANQNANQQEAANQNANQQEAANVRAETRTIEAATTRNEESAELSTVLTTTSLGEIKDKQESTIKDAIISKNTGLQGKNLSLTNITDNSANVTCDGYTGSVTVTFTVTPAASAALSTVLTTTSLGEIKDKQESTIKDAIISKNTGLQGKNLSLTNI
ncbi:MAG: cell envelope integrity protein TolA, partial [Vigna little leaf phytoplasma]|nr:cell envelope integrity protein TolA [Vigna little leaf phytoplasma]